MRFLSRPFSKRVEDSLLSPRLQDVRSMEAGSKLAASRRRSSVPSVTSLSSLPIIPAITEARSASAITNISVSYTHLRAHETDSYLVCRLLLEKKKKKKNL